MKKEYRVQGVSKGHVNVPATLANGETLNALAPSLEAELLPVHGSGTITLRLIGDEISQGEEMLKTDTVIVAEFSAKGSDGAKEAKPAEGAKK